MPAVNAGVPRFLTLELKIPGPLIRWLYNSVPQARPEGWSQDRCEPGRHALQPYAMTFKTDILALYASYNTAADAGLQAEGYMLRYAEAAGVSKDTVLAVDSLHMQGGGE